MAEVTKTALKHNGTVYEAGTAVESIPGLKEFLKTLRETGAVGELAVPTVVANELEELKAKLAAAEAKLAEKAPDNKAPDKKV